MKVIFGAVLGLALVTSPLAARQEPEEKPKQEEPKKQEPPPKTEDKSKPAKDKPQAEQPKQQQKAEEKQQKEQEKQTKEEEKKQPKDNRVQPPQNNVQQNNRGQQSAEHSSGREERIPPQKFQANFGSGHHFHPGHLDDRRRFHYGGYWFEVNQAWPAGWGYDDDCYIEDDDGTYYLVDVVHPGIRILVVVVEA